MPTFQFLEDVRRRSRSGSGHADFSNSKLSKICINQNQLWISEKTIWVLQKVPLKVNEDCPFFGGESYNLIASLSLKENSWSILISVQRTVYPNLGRPKRFIIFLVVWATNRMPNAYCQWSGTVQFPTLLESAGKPGCPQRRFLFIAATKLFI